MKFQADVDPTYHYQHCCGCGKHTCWHSPCIYEKAVLMFHWLMSHYQAELIHDCTHAKIISQILAWMFDRLKQL